MVIPFFGGDIFQAAWCVRNSTGQNQVNVQRFKILSITGMAADQVELAKSLSAAIAAEMKPRVPVSSTYVGLKLTKVPTLGMSAIVTVQGAGAGTAVGDALAPQLAVLTSWKSTGAPARTRGRMYWPSTVESNEDVDGRLTAGAVGNFFTGSINLRSIGGITVGIGTTANTSLVIHRRVAGIETHFEVDTQAVRPAFATQRRRSAINRSDSNFI